jgi:hypothetical protein
MFEKKVFSQHGEDGIIEFLASRQKKCSKRFLEIGYGDGRQNNSLNLSRNYKWTGVGVDLKDQVVDPPNGVTIFQKKVDLKSVKELLDISGYNIDFYSVDIDSIDYWLTISLLDAGLKPAFACVELMNGAGPKLSIAPPLKDNFKYNKFHICGASIQAWRNLWESRGYQFLTVDSSGINAFFYLPEMFDDVSDYPSIGYIQSTKNKGYSHWEEFFSKRANIADCIVTGYEHV